MMVSQANTKGPAIYRIRLRASNSDLALSIDIALQKEAEKAFDGRAGALVALKPGTCEVLGLVSAPSFDPNKFAKGISYQDWQGPDDRQEAADAEPGNPEPISSWIDI